MLVTLDFGLVYPPLSLQTLPRDRAWMCSHACLEEEEEEEVHRCTGLGIRSGRSSHGGLGVVPIRREDTADIYRERKRKPPQDPVAVENGQYLLALHYVCSMDYSTTVDARRNGRALKGRIYELILLMSEITISLFRRMCYVCDLGQTSSLSVDFEKGVLIYNPRRKTIPSKGRDSDKNMATHALGPCF